MSSQQRSIWAFVALFLCQVAVARDVEAAVALSVAANSTSNFAGITAWPSPVAVDTTTKAANPGAYITVTEGDLGNAFEGFSFGQSFTPTITGKLTRILLPVTGNVAGGPRTFNLNIYDGLANDWTDIGAFDHDMDTNPDPYRVGIDVSNNLLTDTSLLAWNGYTQMGATAAVLAFDLTGADQITVEAGKTYITEFVLQQDPVGSFFLGRNGSDPTNYEGGQAFHHREPFQGKNMRDFAMALAIVAPSTLAADFNGVNGVEAADLAIWKAGYGTGTTKAQGDADLDSDVDGNDFLIWQRQLGLTSATSAASAVPEPAAAVLVLFAFGACTGLRRRKV